MQKFLSRYLVFKHLISVLARQRLPQWKAKSSAISGVGCPTGRGARIMTRCLPRTASRSPVERPQSTLGIGPRGIVGNSGARRRRTRALRLRSPRTPGRHPPALPERQLGSLAGRLQAA
jgi:hypothetical protein